MIRVITSTLLGLLGLFIICLFLFILPALTNNAAWMLVVIVPISIFSAWMLGEIIRGD